MCDVAESCTGVSAACPADGFAPSTTVCRSSAGACDAPESCPGTSIACPPDSAWPNGTPCPNASYCDGAETCQAGSCSAGTPVQCADPSSEDVLTCSESQKSCVVVMDAPPIILRDALATAGVGQSYAYNAEGKVRAQGARPMTFGTCGGQPSFTVQPNTGVVSWTPTATGLATLCVWATNAFGNDRYTFSVDVREPAGSAPIARFAIVPNPAATRAAVSLDGTSSSVDPSTTLVAHRWDFGDYSPMATGQVTSHWWILPGGYQPELTVIDGVGREGSAKHSLAILDGNGLRPPSARIVASAVSGSETLTVDFRCQCEPGASPIAAWHWDFGDARTSGETASHTFGPGRRRVRLTVVDAAGLTATDTIAVAVSAAGNLPPSCRLSLDPPAGDAPLAVTHGASFHDVDGTVLGHELTFWDGTTSVELSLTRDYPRPGRYPVALRVADDRGLACTDWAEVVALAEGGAVPPRILSLPPRSASCGEPYIYRPAAAGSGPMRFRLEQAPDAMEIDPETGEVSWVPRSEVDTGPQSAVLHVETPAGSDQQRLEIDVGCDDPRRVKLGCACGSASGAIAWLGLLLLGQAGRAAVRTGHRRARKAAESRTPSANTGA
ncbi:MAG: hypothetical protein HYZ28_27895 [Myxococcales bacterium]|nr:hypothetical protein [Myxococcales bacterium]